MSRPLSGPAGEAADVAAGRGLRPRPCLQAGQLARPPPESRGPHRAAGAAEYSDPGRRGLDQRIFRGHAARPGRESACSGTGDDGSTPGLIVWPESPAPFYTNDPAFRDAVSDAGAGAPKPGWWSAALGVRNAGQTPERATQIFNSAALVSPSGEWMARYDKVHLVPFGEYVPFQRLFSFAGGLTKEVGDFAAGSSRTPLDADGTAAGRLHLLRIDFSRRGAAVCAPTARRCFVNISNDGWYGDSGAYAQHLQQARMRAVENARWLLRDTNTGVTASIDPYGRVVASVPRKLRTALRRPTRLVERDHVLHAPRRLVRIPVCDNFAGGAGGRVVAPQDDRHVATGDVASYVSTGRLHHGRRTRTGIHDVEGQSPRPPGVSLTRANCVSS